METEIDRAQPLTDGVRRQLIGGLGIITFGIVTHGLGGLLRVLKNFTSPDDCRNGFDRENRLDGIDEGGGRTLYEIVYYDRRLGSCWPIGFYPDFSGAVAAVPLALAAQGSNQNE